MILTSLQKLKLIYVLIALIYAEDSCAVIQVGLLSTLFFACAKQACVNDLFSAAVVVGHFLFLVTVLDSKSLV